MCCCCCCCDSDDEKDVKPKSKSLPEKNSKSAAVVSTQPQKAPLPQKVPDSAAAKPTVALPTEKNILDLINLTDKQKLENNEKNHNDTTKLPSNFNLAAVNDRITRTLALPNQNAKKSENLILSLWRKLDAQKLQRSADDPELLETQAHLAHQLVRLTGCYSDALRLSEAVFEAHERSLGRGHLKTMAIHLLYAQTLLHLKEHEEAIESFRKLYEITKLEISKPNSMEEVQKIQKVRLSALQGQALCLKMAWEFEEAMEILEKVYQEAMEIFGSDPSANAKANPITMGTRLAMAKVMKCQGRPKEAKMVAMEVCKNLQTKLLEPPPPIMVDDVCLIFCEHFIGTLVRDEEDVKLGFEILIEILAKEIRIYGPYHPLSLSTLVNFGILFERASAGGAGDDQERHEAAASIYFDVWEKMAATFGGKHPKTLKVKQRLDNLNAATAAATRTIVVNEAAQNSIAGINK